MAGTKFAYVRNFELPDAVLPSTYMVVRIDGKGFHKFSKAHAFAKPNDPLALELMNEAARHVMAQLKGQVTMAFGESDEYSFLLRRDATLYSRRTSKITTHIVSLFTSAYVFSWSRFFPTTPLQYPPTFDGRLVVYPSTEIVRDYFKWRQADTHINNLYNTTFWALVLQGGQTESEATETLRGTFSRDKHEILWRFGINYDRLEAMFRKGTTLVWYRSVVEGSRTSTSSASAGTKADAIEGSRTSTSTTGSGTGTEADAIEETSSSTARQGVGQVDAQRETLEDEAAREGITPAHAAKRRAKAEKQRRKRLESAHDLELVTLHCDIIGDAFWSISAPAPAEVDEPQDEM
ncbi:related to THG1 - protein required for tRNA-His guanylylation at 5` end [Pseudozyma flocculosa]|uniref:tRNA(His) guanylyltransferase n=1 Tax=Pseudozyma flocculosa TaxID=84751 RepID=A0A5C3F9J0_9BASI|nr:related to THG1 - protein required for tRNA-His guanylylation at 5` end [Pseudozyma flocculosa]